MRAWMVRIGLLGLVAGLVSRSVSRAEPEVQNGFALFGKMLTRTDVRPSGVATAGKDRIEFVTRATGPFFYQGYLDFPPAAPRRREVYYKDAKSRDRIHAALIKKEKVQVTILEADEITRIWTTPDRPPAGSKLAPLGSLDPYKVIDTWSRGSATGPVRLAIAAGGRCTRTGPDGTAAQGAWRTYGEDLVVEFGPTEEVYRLVSADTLRTGDGSLTWTRGSVPVPVAAPVAAPRLPAGVDAVTHATDG